MQEYYELQNQFLSTPSARRATEIDGQKANVYYISIHALREEGDQGAVSQESDHM